MSGHTVFCRLCEPQRRFDAEDIWDHLRVVHDLVPEFEEWPDGSPVIVDHTLEPDDFREPA